MVVSEVTGMKDWHERLGHMSAASIQKMATERMVTGLPARLKASDLESCEACNEGKMRKTRFLDLDGER